MFHRCLLFYWCFICCGCLLFMFVWLIINLRWLIFHLMWLIFNLLWLISNFWWLIFYLWWLIFGFWWLTFLWRWVFNFLYIFTPSISFLIYWDMSNVNCDITEKLHEIWRWKSEYHHTYMLNIYDYRIFPKNNYSDIFS